MKNFIYTRKSICFFILSLLLIIFVANNVFAAERANPLSTDNPQRVNDSLPSASAERENPITAENLERLENLPPSTAVTIEEKLVGPLAYVAAGGKVAVIDTSINKKIAEVALSHGVERIALSPDGKFLYAISMYDISESNGKEHHGWLTAMDVSTNKELGNLDMGLNIPRQIAVGPDGKIYVSWETQGDQIPGYEVFDFANNKRWSYAFTEYNVGNVILSFAFLKDGSRVYMSTASPLGLIYVLDWKTNKSWYINLYPRTGVVWNLAADKNAESIYFTKLNSPDLSYLKTSGHNLQAWDSEFAPIDLKLSPEGTSLYIIGQNVEGGNPILYKYTDLKGISPLIIGESTAENNYLNSDPSNFYGEKIGAWISMTLGYEPAHLVLSPDGKNIYITNVKKDYQGNGKEVVVYNAETLKFVAKIPVEEIDRFSAIAITPEKVLFKTEKKEEEKDSGRARTNIYTPPAPRFFNLKNTEKAGTDRIINLSSSLEELPLDTSGFVMLPGSRGALNPQPEPPKESKETLPVEEKGLNPQPEPPKILEGIYSLFKSIFNFFKSLFSFK